MKGEKKMNNKNSGRKAMNCYEDEYGSIKNNNYNFDLEFDMDEANECFMKDMEKSNNEDCEDSEEVYLEGFKDGYEKAIEEVLVYMKKNKCCFKCKCKRKSQVRSVNKNKCFKKCKHGCKRRCTNKK